MGLTNNDIFKKLRVAHKLKDEDIVRICKLADFKVSKGIVNIIEMSMFMNFSSRI